ncbi:MarR family transcriptional regulator [Pseudarthrobacter sp. H3Y2-7]|uniref:MarR family winged helix-turn-helix transcriptional regulator n=1 Tax=Pseudarthrobacter naphthalenicus TaxID=3031328 RepID=UPI0023AF29F8|nr:MarR family transcriptional regulator [Pseudarthrobacter sp. H3Y2-7]MDE8670983.1 MarR family transcriptional regulator [Pseudarthrobacter sp. H3Y2-7]
MSKFRQSVPAPEASEDAVKAALEEVERELSLLWCRARSVSHRLSPRVHPDMEPAAYGLLTIVRQEGSIRLTALASSIGISKSSVSRQIAFLESVGLVYKGADPRDGRAQSIGLTEKGEEKMHQVQDARRQVLFERLAEWPPEEVHKLDYYISKFNAVYGDSPTQDGTPEKTNCTPPLMPAGA